MGDVLGPDNVNPVAPDTVDLPGSENDPMNKNPVLIILNGLAAAAGLVLVATNMLGVTHLDTAQTAAVVAALAGVCNLVALAIRGAVVSPATNAAQVAEALATPVPWQAENGLVRVSSTPALHWRNVGAQGGWVVTDSQNVVVGDENQGDDGGVGAPHG